MSRRFTISITCSNGVVERCENLYTEELMAELLILLRRIIGGKA